MVELLNPEEAGPDTEVVERAVSSDRGHESDRDRDVAADGGG